MKHANARLNVACLLAGFALFLGALVSAPVLAEVYKWTDENGVTHYSQTPPPSGQESEIEDLPDEPVDGGVGVPLNENLDGSGSDGEELSAADQRRQEIAAASAAAAEERAAVAALCRDTQQQLAELEPSRRVYYTDDDGETVRMDDEERVAEVQRLRGILNANCQ